MQSRFLVANGMLLLVFVFAGSTSSIAAFAVGPTTGTEIRNRRQQPQQQQPSGSDSWKRTTPLLAKPKKVRIVEDILDASTTTTPDNSNMPANLKRKVHAKRPALGHIVPQHLKQSKGTGGGGSANPALRPQGKARDAGLNNPSLLKILGGVAKGKRLDSPQVYLRPMMGKVKEAVYSSFVSLGLYRTGRKHIRHLDVFSGSGSVGLESLSRGATHCTFVDFSDDCCAAIQRNMDWCFGPKTTATPKMTQPSSSSSSSYVEDEDDDDMRKTHQIVCADYLQALRDPASVGIDPSNPYQIVTLCPPYEEVIYADLLDAVANSPLVTDDTIVLVEYPVELQTLPHVVPRRPRSQQQQQAQAPSTMTTTTTMSATTTTIVEDNSPGALIGIRNRKYGRTVIALYVCNPTGTLQGAESRPEEFV